MHKNNMIAILFSLLFALSGGASAENSQDFGDFVIHFNALNTAHLPPDATREYGIKRSKNRGMINIAVLHKIMGTAGTPVAAEVSATASNLAEQKRIIAFQEIREANAVYYIGDFPISHEDTLRFTVKVKPEGQAETYEVKFKQEFFTE
jgi:hypothetical protein